jgi:hypothetical protein
MSNPVAAKPLLEEALPRSSRCDGKAVVLFALLAGFGCGALLSKGQTMLSGSGSWAAQDPSISMAWQRIHAQSFLPAKAGTFMQPTGVSTLASSRVVDIRDLLRSSPLQHCVYANKHGSLCGNVVVLRPSTSVRATTGKDGPSVDADEILKGVTEKIDAIEDKPAAVIKLGAAVVAIVITNGIVTSIEALPLLPKLLELVGTGYSAWFTYRYLLNKDTRKELIADFESAKEKVLG